MYDPEIDDPASLSKLQDRDQVSPGGLEQPEVGVPLAVGREILSSAAFPEPSRVQPSTRGVIRAWIRDLVLSLAVSAFVIIFLYQPVRVEGTSMNPGLEDQDRLFINKLAFHVGEIHRGDVVVFHYPHDHTKSYIKRVIALPGDMLRIDHGRVFVNNHFLPEPYVPSRFTDDRTAPNQELAPGDYFLMGDHRSISSDSRDFGPVSRDLIYGKAAFVYWPVNQAGVVH